MRKEVIFAILLGTIIGLVVAFGAWRFNLSFQKETKPTENATESATIKSPTPTPLVTEFKITLAKPQNLEILSSSDYIISGITKPNVYVIAFDVQDEYITRSDQSGVFEIKAQLSSGANDVKIIALDDTSATDTKLTLIYSSEFASLNSDSTATESASNKIIDNVQKKLNDAKSKPVAYIGTITDISESTVQIKTKDQKIQQLSVNKQTSFVKTITTQKDITYADLAIGDFIVALGQKSANNVLQTQRLIVSAPIKEILDIAFIATVVDNTQNLTVTNLQTNQRIVVTASKGLTLSSETKANQITKISLLKSGNKIIIVATKKDDGSMVARRIHLLQ